MAIDDQYDIDNEEDDVNDNDYNDFGDDNYDNDGDIVLFLWKGRRVLHQD